LFSIGKQHRAHEGAVIKFTRDLASSGLFHKRQIIYQPWCLWS
jgi:hypothetical protein